MGEGKVITGALEAGPRLDKALAEASGLSRERVKALIAEGRVTVGGKAACQASAKCAGGDFAIDIMRLKEVIQPLPITVVPRAPTFTIWSAAFLPRPWIRKKAWPSWSVSPGC